MPRPSPMLRGPPPGFQARQRPVMPFNGIVRSEPHYTDWGDCPPPPPDNPGRGQDIYEDDSTSNHSGVISETERIPFPLSKTHEFCLACNTCFKTTQFLGMYQIKIDAEHNCSEDIFAVRLKAPGSELWVRIRERNKYRQFPGKYILCRFYTSNPPQPCMVDEQQCSFAHNVDEQKLWTKEKDGLFNITEFMIQNKADKRGFSISDLFRKHEGILRFLCKTCFYEDSKISFQNNPSAGFCSSQKHVWTDSKLLVHVARQGQVTPIERRPFTHKTAYFLMCHRLHYCRRNTQGGCHFAHSLIERDVWLVERDMEITREQLLLEYTMVFRGVQEIPTPSSSASGPGSVSSQEGIPGFLGIPGIPTTAQVPVQPALRCPYRIIQVGL